MVENQSSTTFDIKKFDMRLETEWLGRNFLYLEELESTNKYLSEESSRLGNGTVVLAEKQHHGRGRNDRVWLSAKGENLTFSILFNHPTALKASLPVLNLGTAVIVANAIENLFQVKTNLKWPNDILVGRKKICGILIETSIMGNDIKKIVIGIGINVNQTSFRGDYMLEPTSIALEGGVQVEREKLLAEFLNLFEEGIASILERPNSIIQAWRDKCNILGDKISITQDGKTIYGIFDDIDQEGNLLLRTTEKTLLINYGDVSIHI
ncbi:MAG: biotin--[acetyl-CoA-carboxylase] ligase [Ignavibacteria bacterium]|nr:biotin--[acetyl-CoA-carboxylase] ligase [Ignavibacteria bacterium]